MMRMFKYAIALFCLVGLAACHSSRMVKANASEPEIDPAKATIIFLRPSARGGAVQATVYETGTDADRFIGIVSSGTKIAWQTEPGDHLFMVVGENADFMIAHLDPGKTYYALVSPRMGVWKARFSLLPIHNDAAAKYNLKSDDFREWMQSTVWIRNTEESEQWFREHAGDIREKKSDYMRKWDRADPVQKSELTLNAADGV